MTDLNETTEGLEAIRLAALEMRGISPLATSQGQADNVSAPESASGRPTGLARWFGIVGQLSVGALTVVIMTGIWLAFLYRPPQSEALGGEGSFSSTVSELHQWSTWLALASGATWLILWALPRVPRLTWFAIPTVVLAVIVLVTGGRMRWTQLAVTDSMVGRRMRGIGPVFNSDVLFGVVQGESISRSSLALTVTIHLSCAVLFLATAFVLARRHQRASSTLAETSASAELVDQEI